MNATERLLVDCCRVGGRVATDPDVQWERFERLAAWHRVAGVAYQALGGAGEAARLAAAYAETCARNLGAVAELDRIAAEFERAGITAMLLKGAALVGDVYDDYGTRPMHDLDLLLREHEVARAAAVLGELGYRPAPPFASKAETLWEQHGRWTPLVRADGMVVVELHRRLGGPATVLGFDVDGWWPRARPTSRAALRRPAPEHLLVHVALHALGDRRLRSEGALGQLRDVAQVAAGRAGGLDWPGLAAEAARTGYGPALALVLAVVGKLGLYDVPPMSGADAGLVDEVITRRVLRDDPWTTLERFGPRTTALRQLLPPRPARVRSAAPYAAWARATARVVTRPGELRREVSFDRALRPLLSRSGGPGTAPFEELNAPSAPQPPMPSLERREANGRSGSEEP